MGNKRRRAQESDEESEEELDEELDEEMEDEDDEAEPGAPGKRPATYNIDAIHEKLEDIGWTTEVEWEETQAITTEAPTQVDNVEDDLARELAFYNQALSAAQAAIRRFQAAGVPWLRPLDYYAEMVKSDEHMAKVKEQLMFEQKQIEAAEERRKQREAKQYGKQVQLAKNKERAAEKKKAITEVTKLRKQREKSGFAGELDMDAQLADMEAERRRPMNVKQLGDRSGGRGGPKAPSKKRQARDSKFGFGGRKSLKKQNDAYSAADMDGYRPGKFKESFGARKGGVQKKAAGGGAKGGKGAQRPGKQRRQAMKGGKGGRR